MHTIVFLSLMGLAFGAATSFADAAAAGREGAPTEQTRGEQAAAALAEPSGRFLKEWLLCGPFPLLTPAEQNLDAIRLPGLYADFLERHGGEANARPVAGETISFPGGERTWQHHVSSGDAVDLDGAVTKMDRVAAYAYRELHSSEAQVCVLALGSNDGARAWLNGELVLDSPGPRGLQLDHNLVPVALRPGSNALLIKVEERGNRWGFACRLLPLSHEFVTERLRLFEVVSREDGTPVIRARHNRELMSALLKTAEFEALIAGSPGRAVWAGTWTPGDEMAIEMDTREFVECQLRIRTEFADGARQEGTLPFTAGRRVERVLFENGGTSYRIFVEVDASEGEKWAARELAHWIREISGATIEIEPGDTGSDHDKVIVVGWNQRARQLLGADVPPPRVGDESFRYRSVGPAIVIWGGRERGTLYGVMSFLERELGVRFYTPRVTVAPKRARYSFTSFDHSETPGIRVRNDFYHEAFDPAWAARNRINGAMGYRDQPGGVECYWSVHTFYPLMPPEEFFADHPEYYSLLDGVRTTERAQLCLSNPDVLRIVTERIRRKMRELPEYLIYDVSQNDWSNPCECEDCQGVVEREGSQSGPVIQFVNQVADAIRAEFPDKFIGTLAYSYTRKPPRTLKPRENVVVRFCSIECCFAHDFMTCPENREFVEDMNGWAAIAPHLYIWDYVVNFSHYLMPYPNFRVLQPNIQFFRDHQAIGIMEQAAYQSRGGEFAELRAYLIARLLWDPEAEVDPIIDDFMQGYYGRAGRFVRAYFDLLHGRLTPDTHIHLGLQHDDKLFSDEFIRESERIFDQAEIVADTEEIRERVVLARLPVLYLKCKRSPLIARQDGSYSRFCEIVKREGITHYAEAGEPHRLAFHAEVEAAE